MQIQYKHPEPRYYSESLISLRQQRSMVLFIINILKLGFSLPRAGGEFFVLRQMYSNRCRQVARQGETCSTLPFPFPSSGGKACKKSFRNSLRPRAGGEFLYGFVFRSSLNTGCLRGRKKRVLPSLSRFPPREGKPVKRVPAILYGRVPARSFFCRGRCIQIAVVKLHEKVSRQGGFRFG